MHSKETTIDKIFNDFASDYLGTMKKNLDLKGIDSDTVAFLTFFLLMCEKTLSNIMVNTLRQGVSKEINQFSELNNEMLEPIIYELSFGSKIKIYERIVSKHECYGDLKKGVSFFMELNGIRNKMFHCKVSELKYKGKDLTKGKTKHLMVGDLLTAVGVPADKQKATTSNYPQ